MTETSTFRDVAAPGDAQKRRASSGAFSPDKSVCSGTIAFSDPQISRASAKAQEKQAFRGVAAISNAWKVDALS